MLERSRNFGRSRLLQGLLPASKVGAGVFKPQLLHPRFECRRPRTSIIIELAPKSGTGGTEYVALRWPGNAQFFHASLERRGLECQDCGGAPDAANSPLGGIEYRFYVIVFNLVQRSEVVYVL